MNERDGRIRTIAIATVTVALSLAANAVSAQSQAAPRERGSIVFGAFITNRDTTTRLDSDLGSGTNIDLESDLGLDTSLTVFRLGGDVWVGERHRFDAAVFDLSRSATRRIEETIEFGDEIFDIDTTVTSENDLSIYKFDYTYALFNRSRGYFGLTGGLYVASTKLSLSEPTLGRAESESLTAPLPLIGIRGDYDVTDRVSLTFASQWFSIDTGDVSGSLRDVYIAGDYRISDRWSLGLAYNDLIMRVDADDGSGFRGSLDWGYDCWLAYLKYDFGNR